MTISQFAAGRAGQPAHAQSALREQPARARARAAASVADRTTLVSFSIGTDLLAAPVEVVERVLRWAQPSAIPNLPGWLEGVIDHRGHMVPVIDMRRRLGREATLPNAQTRIIVFNTQPEWLAAIVDAVPEVMAVEASSIVAPPLLLRGLSGEYILGMVTHRERVVLVLDVAKLLSAPETLVLQALHFNNE